MVLLDEELIRARRRVKGRNDELYQAIVLTDVVDDKSQSGVLLQVDSWKIEFCDRVDLVGSLCKRWRVRAFLCHMLFVMSSRAPSIHLKVLLSAQEERSHLHGSVAFSR